MRQRTGACSYPNCVASGRRPSGANSDADSASVADAGTYQYVVAYGNAAADSYSHICADTNPDGHARPDIYSGCASDRYTSADTYSDCASDCHA